MTKAELERLALLSEECGEVQVAIGKILRHGWESVDPTCADSPTNRRFLEIELGDVLYAIQLLTTAGDLSARRIDQEKTEAVFTKAPWLHHQRGESHDG